MPTPAAISRNRKKMMKARPRPRVTGGGVRLVVQEPAAAEAVGVGGGAHGRTPLNKVGRSVSASPMARDKEMRAKSKANSPEI